MWKGQVQHTYNPTRLHIYLLYRTRQTYTKIMKENDQAGMLENPRV